MVEAKVDDWEEARDMLWYLRGKRMAFWLRATAVGSDRDLFRLEFDP